MSPFWTAVLGASILLNVIMGYREIKRQAWRAKRKYGTKTYGGRPRQRRSNRQRGGQRAR